MTKHKFYNEIVAWAMGCQIEIQYIDRKRHCDEWSLMVADCWNDDEFNFRIKPQPKEKKYFYVYQLGYEYKFSPLKKELMQFSAGDRAGDFKYVGKIEVQDD